MAVLATVLTLFTTEQWIRFSWNLFYGLSQPWRVIPLLLAAIIVPQALKALMVKSSILRNRVSLSAAVLLLIYLIGISPPIASLMVQGLTHFVPVDSGGHSDAIVVLSRGGEVTSSRYDLAIQLWQAQRAPRIFVTSRGNVYRMRHLLQQQDLPTSVVSGTACALTTQDEAISTATLLGPQGVRTIILITDPPHMLRSLLTFSSLGFSVIPHISPMPADLNSVKLSLLALREYAGLLSYYALGRFRQRSIYELQHPSPAQLQTIRDRHCGIEPKPDNH
ncbi:MAG TPA: YdcF family protein [Coleofasciculaceae cyanobacterium]